MLVRTFAKLGCRQFQLNTLHVAKLEDAKKNPHKYKNLIVRIWGWIGYLCELDEECQDHIIERTIYANA